MQSFVYNALPGRVIFGQGTVSALKAEMERAGCTRALLLSTPEQAAALKDIAASIGVLAAGTFTDATMHTPTEVTERALRAARDCDADCTIAFGGGSSTGLGKAIALRTDLIQIVIPTTYAGSEMTPIIGETEGGSKITQRTMKVLPEIVIYDVDFSRPDNPHGEQVDLRVAAEHHALRLIRRSRQSLDLILRSWQHSAHPSMATR